MKFYNTNNKKTLVNLLADFILTYLDPHDSLSHISVTDCVNFIVIGGNTEFSEILDLSVIKQDFSKKFQKYFPNITLDKINFIDIIEYGKKPNETNCLTFGKFFNSERPMYHTEQLKYDNDDYFYSDFDNNLKIFSNNCVYSEFGFAHNVEMHLSSEFPHGYSIKNNRNKLYYSEYVANNLFSIIGISHIEINWVNDVKTLISDSFIDNTKINSMMLDIFDFNLNKFNEKLKEYQLTDDILLPKESKPWLNKDKVNELIFT
jgi:hypothetical protein